MTSSESHADILRKRSFAHVATTNADGSPQVTPGGWTMTVSIS